MERKLFLSGLDLIDMLGKMKRERRITEEEAKILGSLINQYVFMVDQLTGKNK